MSDVRSCGIYERLMLIEAKTGEIEADVLLDDKNPLVLLYNVDRPVLAVLNELLIYAL
jgi:hypothetical protein